MELSHDKFRDILNHQKESLQSLCKEWKLEIETNSKLPEDIIGDINVATGKSELLIQKRFSQFFTLINDSEFERCEKEITLQDLQGFWDIIFFQVEMIKNDFDKLINLKQNGWKFPLIQLNNAQRQRKTPLTLHNKTDKVKCTVAARSTIRDHILAQRKKLKLKVKMDENTEPNRYVADIKKHSPKTAPAIPHQGNECLQPTESPDMKKFEAGFFKIHTPVQKIKSPPAIRDTLDSTQISALPKVLASSALKKRVQLKPVAHKDYSPCMRITRSMKNSSLLSPDLGAAPSDARKKCLF